MILSPARRVFFTRWILGRRELAGQLIFRPGTSEYQKNCVGSSIQFSPGSPHWATFPVTCGQSTRQHLLIDFFIWQHIRINDSLYLESLRYFTLQLIRFRKIYLNQTQRSIIKNTRIKQWTKYLDRAIMTSLGTSSLYQNATFLQNAFITTFLTTLGIEMIRYILGEFYLNHFLSDKDILVFRFSQIFQHWLKCCFRARHQIQLRERPVLRSD